MKSLLIDMGLIEEGADGTITVNMDGAEAAMSDIDRLTQSIVGLVDWLDNGVLDDSFTLDVDADTDAAKAALGGIIDDANALDGTTANVGVDINVNGPNGETGLGSGDSHPLSGLIGDLSGFAENLQVEVDVIPVWEGSVTGGDGTGGAMGPPGMEPITVPVTGQLTEITGLPGTGDGSSAVDGLAQDIEITVTQVGMELVIGLAQATQNAVEGIPTSHDTAITENGAAGVIGLSHAAANAIDAIPDSHSTSISLSGAEAAIGNAHAVANAINAIPSSRSSTISVVTQYSTIGAPGYAEAHGGIAGYAFGGNVVPIRAAEVGFETAHFPTGGTATLPQDGFYNVPQGTYIEPHNSARFSGGGGLSITVPIYGPVYGIDDLAQQVSARIAPVVREVFLDAQGAQVRIG